MLDNQTEPRTVAPLFSVIVPLEFHRGQWKRCWQGWQSQTLDRTAFEIILVVPPNFLDCDKLSELRDPAPRLEYSRHCHDIALCADGAASAANFYFSPSRIAGLSQTSLSCACRHSMPMPTGLGFPANRCASGRARYSHVRCDVSQLEGGDVRDRALGLSCDVWGWHRTGRRRGSHI